MILDIELDDIGAHHDIDDILIDENSISNKLKNINERMERINSTDNYLYTPALQAAILYLKEQIGKEREKLFQELNNLDNKYRHNMSTNIPEKKLTELYVKVKNLSCVVNNMSNMLNKAFHHRDGINGVEPDFAKVRKAINDHTLPLIKLPLSHKIGIGIIAVVTGILFAAAGFLAGLALTGGIDGGLTGVLLATKAFIAGFHLFSLTSLTTIGSTALGAATGVTLGGVGSRYTIFRKSDVQAAVAGLAKATTEMANDFENKSKIPYVPEFNS